MRPLDGVTVAELGGRISAGACGTLFVRLNAAWMLNKLLPHASPSPTSPCAVRSTSQHMRATKRACVRLPACLPAGLLASCCR